MLVSCRHVCHAWDEATRSRVAWTHVSWSETPSDEAHEQHVMSAIQHVCDAAIPHGRLPSLTLHNTRLDADTSSTLFRCIHASLTRLTRVT